MNKYLTAALLVSTGLALGFFVGWVLPDYPYTRRLSLAEADRLFEELKGLLLQTANELKKNSSYTPPVEVSKRIMLLHTKLNQAGYNYMGVASPVDADTYTKIVGRLQPPLYAGGVSPITM